MRIQRDYLVAAPLNDTWPFMRSGEHVARCVPGAKLGSHAGEKSYDGSIAFKVGAKGLTFFGTATFAYDDGAKYGTIDAFGGHRRERSQAKAQIEFSVTGGPGEPRSVVAPWGNVSFAGALAQFASEGGVHVREEPLGLFKDAIARLARIQRRPR
jgi:carbon monoxide dehydrogenase subunit G